MLGITRCKAVLALIVFSSISAFAQGYRHGTAGVVITSRDAIVAAIDSKEINHEYLSDASLVVGDSVFCKVRQTGPYYVLISGISRSADGFNALQEAGRNYREGDSLDEFAVRLTETFPLRITSLLEALRSANRAAFDQAFRNQDALQLTLLGIEHGNPRVVVVTFFVSQSGNGPVGVTPHRTSCPGECSDPNTIYLLGVHDQAETFLQANPLTAGDTRTSLALRLIDLEYRTHPDVVGGPATVIRVTRAGVVVESPGACVGNEELPHLAGKLDLAIAAIANVVVHEDITQYSKRGERTRSNIVSASVRVVAGAEEYVWYTIPGKVEVMAHHLPEPWCGGELATMLRVTLQQLQTGQASVSLDTASGTEPEFLVTFHAAASDQLWQLIVNSQAYPLTFEGSARFSKATGELLGIRWVTTALRLPATTGITRLEWNEAFSDSDITGNSVLTPTAATYRVQYSAKANRSEWTETRFSDFRRFGATAALQFASK